ncbi:MAG: hypothetical protein UHD05_05920 [Ruminococcus sp.]|nr:hypothetical protein [Ruminococcus sp.]
MNSLKRNFNTYKGMTARNIKVYMKDRMAIVLSMLTQIIVLGLYLLFLKSNYVDAINSFLTGAENLVTDTNIEALVNSWLIAGVIGTSVVTVALNSLSVMVSDKQDKIDFDYNATPAKPHIIILSYFSGAVVSTFLISSILLTAGLVFLAMGGLFLYTATDIVLLYAIVLLGSISGSIILMLFVSFFKKNSTLSSFSILISVAIGFIIGAYMPVSQFGESVQTAVNLVPGSHIAGLLRNVLMTPAIDNISDALGGIDNGMFAEEINSTFTLNLNIFDESIGMNFMLVYSLIAIAVFFVLNLVFYKFSSKRKS